MNNFYVYTHSKPDGSVFYVGKGSGNRCNSQANRNNHHRNITKKYGLGNIEVSIVANNLSEPDAFALEIALILNLTEAGFKLANLTAGGEGPTGLKHTDEARLKMSVSIKRAYRENPTLRCWASENAKRVSKLPHVVEARSRSGVVRFSDPIFKARWVNSTVVRNADPAFQAKAAEGLRRRLREDPQLALSLSDRFKTLWADPAWRESRILQMKAETNTDKRRAKNREIINKLNTCAEHRSRQRKASKEVSSRPDVVSARSALMAKVNADPTLTSKRLSSLRAYYGTPQALWTTAMQTANRTKTPYTMLNKNVVVWAKKPPKQR